MKQKIERTAGPTVGTALAYFTVLFATPQFEWLRPEDQVEAVAMLTIIYLHVIIEARRVFNWIINGRKQ